jgi:hypothetical protein
VRQDTGPTWDTSSGLIADPVALEGERWNEVKIPAGQAGIVQRIKMQLETPRAFAVILSQKQISLTALNDRIYPFNPAANEPEPWYERASVVNWLTKRKYLDAWGTIDQPCGYDPSKKSTAGAVPTGLFVESAGFNYETGVEPVLYAYIYPDNEDDNVLLPGRILRNQRTTDF